MQEILSISIEQTLEIFPFLFLTYFLIEFIEFKYGKNLRDRLQKSEKNSSVFLGSLIGAIPQCGFSVLGSALFSKRHITIGTLLAVFLSTSDEALPILLTSRNYEIIALILLIKIIFAILFGYLIDLFLNKKLTNSENGISLKLETGCCGHNLEDPKKLKSELFLHPILHSLKIAIYIFAITILLNSLNFFVSFESIIRSQNTFAQIFTVSILGLIPNCASSVLITQLYLQKIITFGAMIAGLSTGSGLGFVVLFRENKNLKENISILVLLIILGFLSGLIVNLF